jgi:hypothetical protein
MLIVGERATLNGVHFAIGKGGGCGWRRCVPTGVILLCELEIQIGPTWPGSDQPIADTDFHPVAPAERLVRVRPFALPRIQWPPADCP